MKNSINDNFSENSSILASKIFLLFIIGFIPFLFNSCRKETNVKCKDCLVLSASLDHEEEIPLEKLFNKIELIPLETVDNSLIRTISKYDFFNGKHYILDDTQSILFIFDNEGNYLDRIAKKGQGPGEYTLIYDFSLNPQRGQIEMLSPFGFIYSYDFEGNFIKRIDLTSICTGPQRIQIFDDKNYIIWSSTDPEEDGIRIISQDTGELVNSFWQDNIIINSWQGSVFYRYNNEIYFSLALYNTVYKATKDSVKTAYEWNFGNKTMDISRYKFSNNTGNFMLEQEELIRKIESGEILYDYRNHFQNNQYYYARLRFERRVTKNLFYHKKTGKSYFFEYPVEGIRFDLLYFTDECIVGTLRYNEKDKLLNCKLLNETNRQKLLSYKEDDNPYLIKYYFKEN